MCKETIILAAPSGSGKTYISKHETHIVKINRKSLKILDLDFRKYETSDDYPKNFINDIRENLYKYDIIFINSKNEILEEISHNLDIKIICLFTEKDNFKLTSPNILYFLKTDFLSNTICEIYKYKNNDDTMISKFIMRRNCDK